jgi:hypothetical protein
MARKSEENEKMWNLLMEMPQRSQFVGDGDFEKLKNLSIEELRNVTSPVGIIQGYEILRGRDSDYNDLYCFVLNNLLVAGYVFEKTPEGIKTVRSWNDSNYKGTFYHIFTNLILPTFKIIESDMKMTDLGFNFWKKLIDNNPKFSYFVKTGENLEEIESSEELSPYFGDNKSFQNHTFIVKFK